MNINARHSVFAYSETSPRNAFDSLWVHALKVSSFGWLTQNAGQKVVLESLDWWTWPPGQLSAAHKGAKLDWAQSSGAAWVQRRDNWTERNPTHGGSRVGSWPPPHRGVTKFWVKQEEELVRARIFTDRLSIRRTKPGPGWPETFLSGHLLSLGNYFGDVTWS